MSDGVNNFVDNSELIEYLKSRKEVQTEVEMKNHTQAVQYVIEKLTDKEVGVITSLDEIDAVGHRVVHGGEKFASSVIITDEIVNTKPGFVKAMWCGCQECEDKIKEDVQATSRCIPFEQEQLSDVCVCCGKPAKKMVYWGRAY